MDLEQVPATIVELDREQLRIVRKQAEEKITTRDHGRDYRDDAGRGPVGPSRAPAATPAGQRVRPRMAARQPAGHQRGLIIVMQNAASARCRLDAAGGIELPTGRNPDYPRPP